MKQFLIVVLFGLNLIACGSDSSSSPVSSTTGNTGGVTFSGSTSPATASSQNSNQLANAASASAKQATKQAANNPAGIVLTASPLNELARKVVEDVLSSAGGIGNLPSGVSTTINGDCGGSATVNSDSTGSKITITYNSFCSGSAVFSGTAVITRTESSFTIKYTDFKVTIDGVTTTLDMTVACNTTGTSCTFSSDFTGDNGTVYQSGSVSVSGNNTSGFNISGSVSDPDAGKIDFSANGITICTNGNIGSGTINITDSTGNIVITVSFPNCNEMIITFNGTTERIAQP